MYNNGPYFLWSKSNIKCSPSLETRIDKAVKKIQDDVDFVATTIPGDGPKVWLERPNDGTNDYNEQRSLNRQCVEKAAEMLGIEL